jgi:hypothetical protein
LHPLLLATILLLLSFSDNVRISRYLTVVPARFERRPPAAEFVVFPSAWSGFKRPLGGIKAGEDVFCFSDCCILGFVKSTGFNSLLCSFRTELIFDDEDIAERADIGSEGAFGRIGTLPLLQESHGIVGGSIL